MLIQRYQPSRVLQQFHDDINRILLHDSRVFGAGSDQWSPAVDIHDTDDVYVIEAEVPGIDPKSIEVSLDDGVLSLRGERQRRIETGEGDDADRSERYSERRYGRFVRRFSLPDTADGDRIEARAEHGVLKLTVAKKTKSEARRIEVQG